MILVLITASLLFIQIHLVQKHASSNPNIDMILLLTNLSMVIICILRVMLIKILKDYKNNNL